jgi:hypothetical protein
LSEIISYNSSYHNIQPYPTLPYPTLPYPTLPYPTLPYPTLPYPTLPYTETRSLAQLNWDEIALFWIETPDRLKLQLHLLV